MFNQNNEEEKKLDWMYKGPNSGVSREEYLLGRPVDKTLEQLNDEDKQKQQGLVIQPKNRVEHECIPPSIRDFNKLVQAEQVDLSTKLQEDPLVAIKKREEESRRQFLQNPVQLKKLQKALKAQQAKNKKKKKKKKSKKDSGSDSELDAKLTEKLLGKKVSKITKEEKNLDIILIHKYEALKDKLTEDDLRDILNGKFTDSDGSSSEDDKTKRKIKNKHRDSSSDSSDRTRKYKNTRKDGSSNRRNYKHDSREDDADERYRARERKYNEDKHKRRSRSPRDSSEEEAEEQRKHYTRKYDSDDSESGKPRKMVFGLISSDGKKIPLQKKYSQVEESCASTKTISKPPLPVQRHRSKKLTEEEKEKLRQEMMVNAIERDRERARNLKKYRKEEEREQKQQDFDSSFAHKQLLKSANNSSVESRIKSNLNKIQRSSRDMDKNFSRR